VQVGAPVHLALVGLALIGVWPALAEAPPSGKETVPIHGTIQPEQVVAKPGSTVSITLDASTELAFDRCELRVVLPEGLTLEQGSTRAEIADFKPGEPRHFEFVIGVQTGQERRFVATVEVLGLSEEETLQRSFVVIVNPGDGENSTIKSDGRGRRLRVHGVSTTDDGP
jgi:hypothetical protein